MGEQAIQGFLSIFDLNTLPFILLGIMIGIVIGILPGIGGNAGVAMALPFISNMDPGAGLAFLLAMHSVCATGGGVTAVLLNIPGEAYSIATCLDGFPMAQKGEAGRALGAVYSASAFGGIFGGIILIGCIIVVRPIVMLIGVPEYFFLVMIGISLIVTLGSESIVKGLISGMLGIFISFFGVSILTGESRFSFGSIYLQGGFEIVPVCLGIFAIPVVIDLFTQHESISKVKSHPVLRSQVWQGIIDVFRHKRVFLQSSFIGTVVGIIPGIGNAIATFMAYGIAKQTSKHPEAFGHGSIEGVIAPESADNAKEGGTLLPTLALGIPGSISTSLLLGAFMLVGLEPGPFFLKEHTDIVFKLAGTLIFANVVSAAILAFFAHKIAIITYVRGSIVGPLVLVLVVIGAYSATGSLTDLFVVFFFGALGYTMTAFGYNRAPFILGFILGSIAEKYFGLSVRVYGPLFFLKPVPLILLFIIVVVLFGKPIIERFAKRAENAN